MRFNKRGFRLWLWSPTTTSPTTSFSYITTNTSPTTCLTYTITNTNSNTSFNTSFSYTITNNVPRWNCTTGKLLRSGAEAHCGTGTYQQRNDERRFSAELHYRTSVELV
jgi:hypothetical protein